MTLYTVVRVGKRDVVCKDESGIEKRIRRDSKLYSAYLNREDVEWAIDAIRLQEKQSAAWSAINKHKIQAIPEELADMIIEWGDRLDAEKIGGIETHG